MQTVLNTQNDPILDVLLWAGFGVILIIIVAVIVHSYDDDDKK